MELRIDPTKEPGSDVLTLDEALAPDRIAGPRYGEKAMAQVDR
jgi:hypothetical protein